MGSARWTGKIALVTGAAALIGMGALTACSSDTKDKPAETKAPSQSGAPQSPASLAPTEKKSVGSYAPTVTANPAPTALPGNVKTGQ